MPITNTRGHSGAAFSVAQASRGHVPGIRAHEGSILTAALRRSILQSGWMNPYLTGTCRGGPQRGRVSR